MAVRTVRIALTGTLAAVALASTALVAPSVASTGPDGTAAAHRATQEALDAAVEEGVPGALARAEDRKGVWNGNAGVADRTTGRERLPQDRFRVGSITKTFVATVLLQLEAEGRVDLDDTVDSVLPGVVRGNGHDGRRITLRQLLNHTSGVFNYTEDEELQQKIFGDGFFEHRYDTREPRELVDIALAHRPEFAPGTGWSYSNTNFILAGMAVEKLTGRPYATEIERRILRPLGLRATTVPATDPRMPQPSGRAYSTLSPDPAAPVHDVTELNPSVAGAAGGMISNPADLNRFYSALMKGRLLPKQQLKEMRTTVSMGDEAPPAYRYGLGLQVQELPCGETVWGHGGGINGSSSAAVTTADGRHSLSLNFNADRTGDAGAVVEAEFCE
ncbi:MULTISPECIES: serine hydrolase domain-containing protein [unclassified Streptomyces]|uniref:serine hydrolase domain-containing protein n=1 Tax=unclassified Streptomyces TaxID=2593676 RepID=UPI00081DFF49|nr:MULTISPECIES: serine hydrolase domain-containing protein [unclassified Streptomyces]MYZ36243.1 serine hydrolase [Streptomyces sp. SID4917]SCF82055.1 D-alanyl-D-alanine carboxypeptidase [Streptomyces sp. MnatMP-M17]